MSIRQLLEERAAKLAANDGVSVATVHLHAAASDLGTDIRRELDSLVAGVRAAGAAVVARPVEDIAPAAPAQETVAPPAVADPAPEPAREPPSEPEAGSEAAESAS